MAILIKDMEKPKFCYAVIDGEFEYCPFVNTDDDCVLLLKKGICEGTWEEQYRKCPLVETPEPCEDAVSRKALMDEEITLYQEYLATGGAYFYELKAVPIYAIEKLPSISIYSCKGCRFEDADDGVLVPCGFCRRSHDDMYERRTGER